MLKQWVACFLVLGLALCVISPLTVFAGDLEEGVMQKDCSNSKQAIQNMNAELKKIMEESFGPLWFAKPFSLAITALTGIFKDLPVGIINDLRCLLHN